MGKVSKTILTSLVSSLAFLLFAASILAEERRIDLDFEASTLSADIKEAPLRAVVEEIKRQEEGIWFKIWLKGTKTSLDDKVSVRFTHLSIRAAMDRIFSAMNYSLIFDEHGKLLGVFLLGRPARTRGEVRRVKTIRRAPPQHMRRR
jgi:hypothetical protein